MKTDRQPEGAQRPATTPAYSVVDSSYGDPRLRRDFRPGGRTPTAWDRRPERSEWVEHEVRRYGDGTEVRWERECGRWSNVGHVGDWTIASDLRARRLEAELISLRTYVALYLHTLDQPGTQPSRPLREAPNPARHARVWRPYLEREAAKAPRLRRDAGGAS
ncbi:MAG: hypothetical protein GY716_15840 [bacterium]|nr:hypothetical protein [bacterium]